MGTTNTNKNKNRKPTNGESNMKKTLQQLVLQTAILDAARNTTKRKALLSTFSSKKDNNNENTNNYNNRYVNSSGKYRKIPEPTNFYNQYLRRFFYKPSVGFYIILGLDKNGHTVKRRVPGHFFYRYDKKLGRIVPFSRSLRRPVVEKQKTSSTSKNFESRLIKALSR